MSINYLKGAENDKGAIGLKFGVTKEEDHEEGGFLEMLEMDWSISIDNGLTFHNGEKEQIKKWKFKGTTYGYWSKEGDTLTCICDWVNGCLSFIHNGRYLGIAFKDDNLKKQDLYFALSFKYAGQSVQVIEPVPISIPTSLKSIQAWQKQMALGTLFSFDKIMSNMKLENENLLVAHTSEK